MTNEEKSGIYLQRLTKQFGKILAVDDISVHVGEGEFLTLLRSSGCGETSPCLGGFCGGAEGVAMQPLLWVLSASSQAISRNSHFPFFTIPKVLAGPLEPMTFYETAATVSALVASGSHIEALSTHKNSTVDLQTPEGPAFASEVAHAVVGIPRKEINRIVLTLLDEYKDRIENPPRGKSYPEAYDIDAAVPFPATKKIYNEMKKKIKNKFGFKFKY
ncbi:MAG TPA: monomethylamine:corrinoid methyltransferase [Desulfobacterales bacterium]|nr:monomethylamine:corrinoid methyltransferase [Desulfobacterales bacterium]